MKSDALTSAIVHACATAPRTSLREACELLCAEEGLATLGLGKLMGILSKESLLRLHRAAQTNSTSCKEMALALRATLAGMDYSRLRPDIQLVWTGPDTAEGKPRDTLPQMLEMIGKAQTEILLVTFAAFKAHAIMSALENAYARGVKVTIVTESVKNSAGQLTHDAWKAFPSILHQEGCLWHWPLEKRTTNAKGMPGKLHAKCLVIGKPLTMALGSVALQAAWAGG